MDGSTDHSDERVTASYIPKSIQALGQLNTVFERCLKSICFFLVPLPPISCGHSLFDHWNMCSDWLPRLHAYPLYIPPSWTHGHRGFPWRHKSLNWMSSVYRIGTHIWTGIQTTPSRPDQLLHPYLQILPFTKNSILARITLTVHWKHHLSCICDLSYTRVALLPQLPL